MNQQSVYSINRPRISSLQRRYSPLLGSLVYRYCWWCFYSAVVLRLSSPPHPRSAALSRPLPTTNTITNPTKYAAKPIILCLQPSATRSGVSHHGMARNPVTALRWAPASTRMDSLPPLSYKIRAPNDLLSSLYLKFFLTLSRWRQGDITRAPLKIQSTQQGGARQTHADAAYCW